MRNRLAGESSPYLLQHAGNPVDWYPWGAEAFDHARSKNRPIFLSIGYSACHWCHVMEHESFTDASTAALMNDLFISIKVDREERPDLDAIYMQAVTALTGQGGWPLSVWLTPQGVPFYGGTYFPPSPRYGRPSFRQVLEALAELWKERPGELDRAAARVLEHLSEEASPETAAASERILSAADEAFQTSFDPVHGGWGDAPKFPQPLALEYLLARRALAPSLHPDDQTATTLDSMAAGGLYDHLGGGFHRYSVDEAWRVPHFEKMLYDNAQLARCYLHAWQVLGNDRYRAVSEETLDYLLDRMRHPLGGFFSAEDADSEGREGAFYTWTPDHLREALAPGEAELAATTYGVTAEGNFEGQNVLYLPAGDRARDPALALVREKLRRVRESRVRPGRDDKILAGWNGIALAALAEAARVLNSERYLEAAIHTGRFLQSALVRDGARLAHSWKDGRTLGNGFLDDYACTVEGLLALYQATGEEGWFGLARDLTAAMSEFFRRPRGGFFDTSCDHERLILRPRSLQDSPTPCGNSMAATILLKMAALAGESGYRDLAEETLATTPPFVERAPTVAGQWLLAHFLAETGFTEIAIVGDAASAQTAALLAVVDRTYLPAAVIGRRSPGAASLLPMLLGREPAQGAVATAWVCRQSACLAPTSDAARLKELLSV